MIASKVFTSQENCAVVGSANHYGNGPLFKAYCKNTHTVVYLINTSVFILDHQVDTIVRQHYTKIWFYYGGGIFISLEIIKMLRVWRIINMVRICICAMWWASVVGVYFKHRCNTIAFVNTFEWKLYFHCDYIGIILFVFSWRWRWPSSHFIDNFSCT